MRASWTYIRNIKRYSEILEKMLLLKVSKSWGWAGNKCLILPHLSINAQRLRD